MKASDWQLPGLCSDVWELNVFPKKNVCGILVQFCVQLQCSPDVNLLLDRKFLIMLLLLRVI